MRLLELDSFRGLAAFAVILYHYNNYFFNPIPIFSYGNFGVQIFFIISGFVIFMTLQKIKRPKDFLITRFSRLYPTYWTAAILTFITLKFTPFPTQEVTFSQLIINLTMMQHWFGIQDIDGVYWSLAIELFFYLQIFLLLVWGNTKYITHYSFIWLILMLATQALIHHRIFPHINYYYQFPLLRNGTLFIAGIHFYLLKYQTDNNLLKHLMILLCLGIHFWINGPLEGYIISGFFCLFYLFTYDKLGFLKARPLVFLGTISYPFYLIQQNIGFEILNFLQLTTINSIIIKGIITITIIGLISTFITFMIEKPANKWLRKQLNYH